MTATGGAGVLPLRRGENRLQGSRAGLGLNRPGMGWTVGGADAITALRCREASSQ